MERCIQIAGIDLAWRTNKNPTALAIGSLKGGELKLNAIANDLYGIDSIVAYLNKLPNLYGIAIDGPLIIQNSSGQRKCETLIGQEYGSRHASCHTSNLKLFPMADSVQLSRILSSKGFQHLGANVGRCRPTFARLVDTNSLEWGIGKGRSALYNRRQ